MFGIPCRSCVESFQPWDSVPTLWGSFPALGFRAHSVGKLSSLGIPCPRRGEAFQPWDSAPTLWGSFPALGFCTHAVGKFSSFGIPSCTVQEAFATTCHIGFVIRCNRAVDLQSVSSANGSDYKSESSITLDCKSSVTGTFIRFSSII